MIMNLFLFNDCFFCIPLKTNAKKYGRLEKSAVLSLSLI